MDRSATSRPSAAPPDELRRHLTKPPATSGAGVAHAGTSRRFVRPGVLNRLVTAKRGSSTFRASSAGSGGSSGVGASAAAPPRGGNLGRRRVAVGAQGDGIHEAAEMPRALAGIFRAPGARAGGSGRVRGAQRRDRSHRAPRPPRPIVTPKAVLEARTHNAHCPLLNLPEGVLARIMCHFRHTELGKLFLVCTQLRDAAAACVSVHFNYLTPTRDSPRPGALGGVGGGTGEHWAATAPPVPRSAVPSASARAAALAVAEDGLCPPGAPLRHRRGRRRYASSRGAAAAKAAAPSRAAAAAAGDAQARRLVFERAFSPPPLLASPPPLPKRQRFVSSDGAAGGAEAGVIGSAVGSGSVAGTQLTGGTTTGAGLRASGSGVDADALFTP